LQKAAEAESVAAAAAAAAAERAARVAEERRGLQETILRLQGNTNELRRRELATLDPTNRALKSLIFALEDAAARAAKAAEVARERDGLERTLLELQGNTAELRRRELAALDPANRALQQQIWALQDAEKAVNRVTDALEEINPEDFISLIDYNRALARQAAGMSPANSPSAPSYVNPVGQALSRPQTQGGDALLAEVRGLRDETRQLLIRVDRSTKRTSDTLVKWDNDGLPEERVA
jgi:hypothetical protein